MLDIFDHHAGGRRFLDYNSSVKTMAEHRAVVQFISAEGTERYGSGMGYR